MYSSLARGVSRRFGGIFGVCRRGRRGDDGGGDGDVDGEADVALLDADAAARRVAASAAAAAAVARFRVELAKEIETNALSLMSWAKERALGCVNSPSAAGIHAT